jgi:hypothetical protein
MSDHRFIHHEHLTAGPPSARRRWIAVKPRQ